MHVSMDKMDPMDFTDVYTEFPIPVPSPFRIPYSLLCKDANMAACSRSPQKARRPGSLA